MFKIISGGQKRCKHLKHKWCQLYGQIYKVLSLSDIYVCVPINSYKNIFITFSKTSIYLQHTVVYFICIREYYGQCFPIWKAQFPLQPWKQTALTGVALQWISSLPQPHTAFTSDTTTFNQRSLIHPFSQEREVFQIKESSRMCHIFPCCPKFYHYRLWQHTHLVLLSCGSFNTGCPWQAKRGTRCKNGHSNLHET